MSENKLNIQLTVTDEQMASLLKGKLESLPDEKIQEIFANALAEFLKSSTGQQLFYTTDGFYRSNPKPSQLLEKMVSDAVSKDVLQPEVDALLMALRDRYPEFLKQTMISVFSSLFFDNITKANIQATMGELLGRIDTKEDKK